MEYKIYCKSTTKDIYRNPDERLFWCITIYQKWDEEDLAYKRRAKRVFKKYCEKNAAEHRKFFLIED